MNIDTTLYLGRPEACADRLPRELACYDLLDRLEIPYTRIDHETAATIAHCQAVEQYLGAPICKNLFLCNRQKTDFYLLVMAGEKPFHTKDLSKQIGTSRLSFAPAEQLEALLGVGPGSASVLGLMNDQEHRVKLVLDRSALEGERFGCHPCINTSSLALSVEDLRGKLLPALGVEPLLVDLPDEGENAEKSGKQ